MTDLTARQAWSDIIDAVAETPPPAHALTRQQFMEQAGLGNTTTALYTLNRSVNEGRLQTTLYRNRRYWWPTEGGDA